jgi:hypothetical protein
MGGGGLGSERGEIGARGWGLGALQGQLSFVAGGMTHDPNQQSR